LPFGRARTEKTSGWNTLRLYFAETFDGVSAGGAFKPVIKEIKGVDVSDKLAIDFETKEQDPEINGIKILAE